MKFYPLLGGLATLALGTLLHTPGAQAVDLGPPGELFTVELHGFVSQGFILSTDNDYLTTSHDGSFEFSEVGLNVTVPLADRLRVGMQLFAHRLGENGGNDIEVDWFYLGYRWQDWLGLRAGRVKIPFGLFNDISDIDAARAQVLLPQSVYPIENRFFLLAQTGVEAYGILRTEDIGSFDYNAYVGTLSIDPEDLGVSAGISVEDLRVPYVAGGRLMWSPTLTGLRLGGSVLTGKIDANYATPLSATPIAVTLKGVLWVASLEYDVDDLQLAAEYGRWHLAYGSDSPLLPATTNDSERAYASAAWRLDPTWQLSLYYSLLFPDVSQRSGVANQEHDLAFTLRWDINSNWLVKLEAHYLHGTAALDSGLNGGVARDQLEGDWGLFLVKTTAYF